MHLTLQDCKEQISYKFWDPNKKKDVSCRKSSKMSLWCSVAIAYCIKYIDVLLQPMHNVYEASLLDS